MKLPVCVSIVLLSISSLASAQQQGLLNIYCGECRDLTQHPQDARNFSYNQVFGVRSWLTADQADRFQITDRLGNTVTIDMNIDYRINFFAGRIFELGDLGNLIVETIIVQIRVIYRNLDIVTYTFSRLDVPGELPVGDNNTRQDPPDTDHGGGGDNGGDGGDGSDSFNDASDYEFNEDDYGDDREDEDVICANCTLQSIDDYGNLGDPVEMDRREDLEEMWEL